MKKDIGNTNTVTRYVVLIAMRELHHPRIPTSSLYTVQQEWGTFSYSRRRQDELILEGTAPVGEQSLGYQHLGGDLVDIFAIPLSLIWGWLCHSGGVLEHGCPYVNNIHLLRTSLAP